MPAESQKVEPQEEIVEEVSEELEQELPEVEGEPGEGEAEAQGEEVEVVLEGEEEKPASQQKVSRRVKKLLERTNTLETSLETEKSEKTIADERIIQLEAQLAERTPQQASTDMPLPPTLEQCDYDDEALKLAQSKYQTDVKTWISSQNQSTTQQNAQAETQRQTELTKKTALDAHYKRADELKVSDYDSTEAKAVEVLGKDMVKAIAMTFPNSARIINYLGKNENVTDEIMKLNATNPQAGVAKLWELNFKLKDAPRKRSNAPEPESKVEGGFSKNTSALQKQYDAAADKGDLATRKKLRAQAKANGIKLE